MNTLHVHSGNIFGGVERMLETLAPGVAGDAPVHSTYALCFEGRTAEALERVGGTVHRLGPVHARRVDEIWRARRNLRALLASRSWDAVCVHSAWSQGIFGPTILKSALPLVRWLHAPEPGPRWMEAWSARSRPSLVICNSEYTRRASGDRFGRIPVTICHPPARMPAARLDARADIRSRMGTPPGTTVIIIAARLEAGKGHEVLLDSLASLPPRGWELWVVGGPHGAAETAYYDGLVARSRRLSAPVRFPGAADDVEAWMQAADIYCQPNRSPDSFGLSFVEAMAAGLPVVTTRLGGAVEVVDETCGILVPPGAAAGVAEALRTLLEDHDLRSRLGSAARARAAAFCDLHGSLARIAKALQLASNSLALT